ncbi:hypothetical protein F5Y10DRAFT_266845 [Nemania abortiva]|nr:hypothetical protein F5Y10DRAFT_266845 [Nemania abortiva]
MNRPKVVSRYLYYPNRLVADAQSLNISRLALKPQQAQDGRSMKTELYYVIVTSSDVALGALCVIVLGVQGVQKI